MWLISISWLEKQRWELHGFFRRETKNVFIWVLLTIVIGQMANELKTVLIWYVIFGGGLWFSLEGIYFSIKCLSTIVFPWNLYSPSDWTFPACVNHAPIFDKWPRALVITACPYPALYTPSQNWENYVVEFQAKELKLNAIAWTIRSSEDGKTCLMLQYDSDPKTEGIRPHIFINGASLDDKSPDESVRRLTAGNNFRFNRSTDGYIWVRCEVFNQSADALVVRVYDLGDFRKLVFEWLIPINLFEGSIPALRTMKSGSVGFRNCQFEMARYRKIRLLRFIS